MTLTHVIGELLWWKWKKIGVGNVPGFVLFYGAIRGCFHDKFLYPYVVWIYLSSREKLPYPTNPTERFATYHHWKPPIDISDLQRIDGFRGSKFVNSWVERTRRESNIFSHDVQSPTTFIWVSSSSYPRAVFDLLGPFLWCTYLLQLMVCKCFYPPISIDEW